MTSVESMMMSFPIVINDRAGQKRRLFSCAHVHGPAACHARRMELRKASHGGTRAVPAFNAQTFLDSSGIAKTIMEYGRGETIFTQGDA